MTSVMLDAAMEYADRGVAVFPVHGVTNRRCECGKDCESPGKHPEAALVRTGVTPATTDISLIQNWWERYPTASMATPTSWTTMLDVDPRNSGDETLRCVDVPQQRQLRRCVPAPRGGARRRHVEWNTPPPLWSRSDRRYYLETILPELQPAESQVEADRCAARRRHRRPRL